MTKRKIKINKSLTKRFKISKSGKVLFRGSHIRHLRRKKKKSQIRRQKVPQKIKGKLKNKVKKILGKA